MFRGSEKTEMSKKLFGVGSVIFGNENYIEEHWLVIGHGKLNAVALLSNKTFELVTDWVTVECVNHLSEAEVRKLIEPVSTKLNWTFTDFDFSSAGMKEKKFNVQMS